MICQFWCLGRVQTSEKRPHFFCIYSIHFLSLSLSLLLAYSIKRLFIRLNEIKISDPKHGSPKLKKQINLKFPFGNYDDDLDSVIELSCNIWREDRKICRHFVRTKRAEKSRRNWNKFSINVHCSLSLYPLMQYCFLFVSRFALFTISVI